MLFGKIKKAKKQLQQNRSEYHYFFILEKIPLRVSFSVIIISLFLLIETLIAKTFMLKQAGSYVHFLDPLRVSRKETVFILVISFLLILFFILFRKASGPSICSIYALIAYVFSFSLIAHVILFKTTGLGLNREYLHNFLDNPGEDLKMILSQVKWFYGAGLILLLLFFIWLAMFFKARWFQKLISRVKEKAGNQAKKIGFAVVLIFLIFLEAMVLMPPLESVHPAIKQVPFFELAKSFLPEKDSQEDNAIEILPEERLDRPIILEPGNSFRPLNVVLIIFESLSWKYCDVYKPGLGVTPFLGELSKKALVIDKLYTVDPHTTKALIPIIAGIYPYPEIGVLEAKPGILPEKALPHLLRKFGYRTAFFQTANNYEERPTVVSNLGYETFRGLYDLPQQGFAYVNYFGREEMMMLKPSLQWVDEIRGQPFFLTYLTLSTHHEYGFPPDFPAKDFGVKNENQNRYLNAARYIDYFIKHVFEEFEKRGLIKKTIFVIVGDHGEAFGEHGLTGHNYTLWEEGIRVPGIIYAPCLFPRAGRIHGFRSVLDIAPTICELLDLKVMEGEFLGKSLFSPSDDNRELFYTGWSKSRVMAYRQGKYKYIFPYWSPLPEVYDNLSDVDDMKNLFKNEPQIVAEAEKNRLKLKRWAETVIAQYRQWEKEKEETFRTTQPESFIKKILANYDNLLSVYGFGFFPERTEPGRTFWVRVGIKCENRIKRPLRIVIVIRNEPGDILYNLTLPPRLPLEKLEPGSYTTAESIAVIPADCPAGVFKLWVGLLDERREAYLKPKGTGFEPEASGLIYLGELTILPALNEKTEQEEGDWPR